MKKSLKSKLLLCVFIMILIVSGSALVYAAPETGDGSEETTEEDGVAVRTESDGTIVVTKEWGDELSGEDADDRTPPDISIIGKLRPEELLEFFYPVGSYYETSTNTDPNEAFGGVWVKETEGMVHLSGGNTYQVSKANDNGGAGAQDGGRTDVIMPPHTHTAPAVSGSTGYVSNDHAHYVGVAGNGSKSKGGGDLRDGGGNAGWWSGISANHVHYVTINATTTNSTSGSESGAGQNMQPYVNVHRWHKIASEITLDSIANKFYEAVDLFYPIGSYYETSDADFKPAELWGGEWELESEGRVHVSAGSNYAVGSTGGRSDAIVPTHTHGIPATSGSTGNVSADHTHNTPFRDIHTCGSSRRYYAYNYGAADSVANWGTSGISANHYHGFTVPAVTSGNASGAVAGAGQNMQPYINVYKWKRIG